MNSLTLLTKNQYRSAFFGFSVLICTIFYSNYGYTDTRAEDIIQNNCRSCHGIDGQAMVENWPNLKCQNRGYLYDRMLAFKNNEEHDIDKNVRNLTLEEINEISRYYAELECIIHIK